MEKMRCGVVLSSLQPRLRAVDPDQCDDRSLLYEPIAVARSDADLDALWRKADRIYNDARRCCNDHQDESVWIKIVTDVFAAAGAEDNLLRVHSVQTQTIGPSFVPQHASQSFAQKTDFALAFSDGAEDVARTTEPVLKARPGLALSQMTDAYTSTLPLVCGVEVKEQGGNYNEAIVQLAVWSAAGLARLNSLWKNGSQYRDRLGGLPPFLGWTVVGHEWRLRIAWKDADGKVTVLGPWRVLDAGTGSHAEILMLLGLVRSIKQWLEEEYWPWFRQNVLDGLR